MNRSVLPFAILVTVFFSWSIRAVEIEEIIVTASKRESVLQETPIAVSVVSREEITKRGLDNFSQLQFAVPALVFSEIADMAQITMRGVGVDISEMSAEPGVALHVDGVYRGGLVSSSSLVFDVERIEVLRGPQGTLFGRNASGGSLNVVSRLPGGEAAFDAAVLYGDYGRSRVELSGDVPLIPGVLAARVAVARDERDGYADNGFTGQEEDDHKSRMGKLAVVWNPTDTLEVILRGEFMRSEIGGPPLVGTDDHPVPPLNLSSGNPGGLLSTPNGLCGALSCEDALGLNLSRPGVGSSDPRNPYYDGRIAYERESSGGSAMVTWDVSDKVQVKSVSSYFQIEQFCDESSVDGTDIPYLTQYCHQETDEWSQELTLSGTSGQWDWVGGVYYYDSNIEEQWFYTLPALQATFEAIFGIFGGLGGPLPPGSLAAFGTRLDGTTTGVPLLHFEILQDTYSTAAYGQTNYNFTDSLRGTVGIRWTKDEKEYTQSVVNNLGGAPCVGLFLEDDWREVTGKVGLDYDWGDNTLVYGSVSTGYKSGGFNGGSCGNGFDPENITAYEIGTKSGFLDNTLQLNMTAFYYDYKDLQARLFINNASVVENASDAITYGFEAEMLWLINEVFRVNGSVSFLSAEFQDFISTDPLNPQIGFGCDASGLSCKQQLKGNDVQRSPATKFSMSAEYDVQLGAAGMLTLRGEYSFTDDMYHTVFNNDFALQDDISMTNLRVIWTPADGSLEGVTVATHIPSATIGGTISSFGPPQTWGLQVRYSR